MTRTWGQTKPHVDSVCAVTLADTILRGAVAKTLNPFRPQQIPDHTNQSITSLFNNYTNIRRSDHGERLAVDSIGCVTFNDGHKKQLPMYLGATVSVLPKEKVSQLLAYQLCSANLSSPLRISRRCRKTVQIPPLPITRIHMHPVNGVAQGVAATALAVLATSPGMQAEAHA
jgi:hypothetical protein